MSIPDAVVQAAIHPELDLPVPPPEHPFERVDRDGYLLGVFRGATFGFVFVQTIVPDDVERTLSATRAFFVERGIGRGGWVPRADSVGSEGAVDRTSLHRRRRSIWSTGDAA